jgi:plastocyanin
MKRFLGFLILIIVLVAASGCTQPSQTTPVATTVATEVPTPVATTIETTIAPTPVPTTEATVAATAVMPNVTAPAANTTMKAADTTAAVTAKMTPSTKITIVHIANGTFSPSPLVVLPGTRITWVNDDKTVHSIKMIGKYTGKFNSGDVMPNTQTAFDFNQDEATYEYADGYNMNMTGTIIVQKGESLVGNVVMITPYVTSNATW